MIAELQQKVDNSRRLLNRLRGFQLYASLSSVTWLWVLTRLLQRISSAAVKAVSALSASEASQAMDISAWYGELALSY